MTLKVFADRMSQPSRAVIMFCKLNRINFEEVKIDISKRQHLSPEFAANPLAAYYRQPLYTKLSPEGPITGEVLNLFLFFGWFAKGISEVNPMRQVPAVVDGRLKLNERYPTDVSRRAKIHSVLDWHHSNLRFGATRYVVNTTLAPAVGCPLDPEAAHKAEKVLDASLSKIESIWLEGSVKFLLGSNQPSVEDLSLVCEIMQLEVLDDKDRARILNPYSKVQEWIAATKNATQPHFDDVHGILYRAKAKFQKQRQNA